MAPFQGPAGSQGPVRVRPMRTAAVGLDGTLGALLRVGHRYMRESACRWRTSRQSSLRMPAGEVRNRREIARHTPPCRPMPAPFCWPPFAGLLLLAPMPAPHAGSTPARALPLEEAVSPWALPHAPPRWLVSAWPSLGFASHGCVGDGARAMVAPVRRCDGPRRRARRARWDVAIRSVRPSSPAHQSTT